MLLGAVILTVLLGAPLPTLAQLPGGVQMPGKGSVPTGVPLPTGALSKDALLQQSKDMVADLTSMKSSGKLTPPQMNQVDGMLPKAQSVASELEKPQVEASKLSQLASTLTDLQKQVGQFKAMMK
jgi:hypothetical protein